MPSLQDDPKVFSSAKLARFVWRGSFGTAGPNLRYESAHMAKMRRGILQSSPATSLCLESSHHSRISRNRRERTVPMGRPNLPERASSSFPADEMKGFCCICILGKPHAMMSLRDRHTERPAPRRRVFLFAPNLAHCRSTILVPSQPTENNHLRKHGEELARHCGRFCSGDFPKEL